MAEATPANSGSRTPQEDEGDDKGGSRRTRERLPQKQEIKRKDEKRKRELDGLMKSLHMRFEIFV